MLALRGVTSGHLPRVPVLRALDLEVRPGEILAVLGRNGAGKTTLFRTVMGLAHLGEGSIAFEGRPIARLRPEAIARLGIGYVPQGRALFGELTVAQNVTLGALGRDLRRGTVPPDLAERFPILAARADQPAGTLSGGEQQQVAIARALAARPRLLLLDEPSEGIQPSIVAEIGRTLRELVTPEGLIVMLAEQNLDLVDRVADRCLILERGRIVAEHAPAELLASAALLRRHLGV